MNYNKLDIHFKKESFKQLRIILALFRNKESGSDLNYLLYILLIIKRNM